MTLSITKLCPYAECYCAECRDLFIVMLSVIMLSVVVLSVAMLNVVMLSVVAPYHCATFVLLCQGWGANPGSFSINVYLLSLYH